MTERKGEVVEQHAGARREPLTLQDLEVLYVGILGVDVELDAVNGHILEDAVVDLAESGSIL